MKRLTEYQEKFDEAQSDVVRASILRSLLLNIAKELQLITKNKNLIAVTFEKMNCWGRFKYADNEGVYLDTSFTEKDASIRRAVSVYLHECAHLLVFIRDYDSSHNLLFYAVNLAINIKFDQLLKEVDPDFVYLWCEGTLRMYNIYEDQHVTCPQKIDYEKLGNNLAEATKMAFKYSQNNNKTVNHIIKKLCSEYDKKMNIEYLENTKKRKRYGLIETSLARLAFVSFCFLTAKALIN